MQKIEAPFETYNGGKSGAGVYQQIINLIPPITEYHEYFVGNGGIVRKLHLPARTVINDLDRSVIAEYKKQKLKNVLCLNRCAMDLLAENAGGSHGKFIYLDPPYRKAVRASKKDLYKFEMTDKQHERFLKLASTNKNMVMISHYNDDMYNEYLTGWNVHEFPAMTRRGMVMEQVYYNYQTPTLLQDYRYIGNDYRERELIKRKVKRQLEKINRLPAKQRIAIPSAVNSEKCVT